MAKIKLRGIRHHGAARTDYIAPRSRPDKVNPPDNMKRRWVIRISHSMGTGFLGMTMGVNRFGREVLGQIKLVDKSVLAEVFDLSEAARWGRCLEDAGCKVSLEVSV